MEGDRHSSDPDICGRRGPFKLASKHRRLRASERRNEHLHRLTQYFQRDMPVGSKKGQAGYTGGAGTLRRMV